jgi:hypothetical protein
MKTNSASRFFQTLAFAAVFLALLLATSCQAQNLPGSGTTYAPYELGVLGETSFTAQGFNKWYRFTILRQGDLSSVITCTFPNLGDTDETYVLYLYGNGNTAASDMIGTTDSYAIAVHRSAGPLTDPFPKLRFEGFYGWPQPGYKRAVLPLATLLPGTYVLQVKSSLVPGDSSYGMEFRFPSTPSTFAINPANRSVGPGATLGSVSVTTESYSVWKAVSDASWLTVLTPGSFTGPGTFSYSASTNTSTSARTGRITVGSAVFTLTQRGKDEDVTLSPASRSHTSRAGTGSFNVQTGSSIAWSASAEKPWIDVTGRSSGTGSGTVNYSVRANTTAASRTGTIDVEGKTFTITQAADDGLNPPVILTAPTDRTGQPGDTIALQVTADGSPTLAYQWFFNGTALAGATAATLNLADAQGANSGSYSVRVSNGAGAVTSAPVTVIIAAATPYSDYPATIPGLIQAAEFDKGPANVAYSDKTPGNAFTTTGFRSDTSVDVEPTSDAGGGYDIAANEAGEWQLHTVNVGTASRYTLELRYAGGSGNRLHLEFDGQDVTGPIYLPATGSTNTWTNHRMEVFLPAGQQVMRVVWDAVGTPGNGAKLRSLRFLPEVMLQRTTNMKIGTSLFTNKSDPYPSQLDASGLNGTVTSVEATLTGLRHEYPADLDIMLVHGSKQVLLLSDWGGGTDVNATLTFADGAPSVPSPIVSGRWRPTTDSGSDSWPQPGPTGTYYTQMSAFNYTAANDYWKLYIVDDTNDSDTGHLDSWSLRIAYKVNTAPSLSPIDDLPVLAGNATASTMIFVDDSETAYDELKVTVSSSNPSLVPASSVTLEDLGGGAYLIIVEPVGNVSGTAALTVTVKDAEGAFAFRRFLVTVEPTLSNLAVSAGTLTPAFYGGITNYTTTVSNATTSIAVTPTVAQSTSTVKVNGVSVASGAASGAINLAVGPNTIKTVVAAQSGSTKTYTLVVTRAASAPSATTSAASAVVFNRATLNGTVNPNGLATSAHFEFGLTTDYGTPTGSQSAGAGNSAVPRQAIIGNLMPNTTYHYRLVATNSSGTTKGPDRTFTTPDNAVVGTWAERTVARTLPITAGGAVDIGTLTFSGGSGIIEAAVSASGSGWSVAKRYVIPIRDNSGGGSAAAPWVKVLPTHDTGPYGVNDFALDVNVSGKTALLRLRTVGSTSVAATAKIAMKTIGLESFLNSSGTAAVAAPAQTVGGNAVEEMLGKAGVGVAPAGNAVLDINGGETRGLRLRPRSTTGAPKAGAWNMGTMILDSAGNLFICTAPGTPGTWKKVGN